jgi:hypothetical protein
LKIPKLWNSVPAEAGIVVAEIVVAEIAVVEIAAVETVAGVTLVRADRVAVTMVVDTCARADPAVLVIPAVVTFVPADPVVLVIPAAAMFAPVDLDAPAILVVVTFALDDPADLATLAVDTCARADPAVLVIPAVVTFVPADPALTVAITGVKDDADGATITVMATVIVATPAGAGTARTILLGTTPASASPPGFGWTCDPANGSARPSIKTKTEVWKPTMASVRAWTTLLTAHSTSVAKATLKMRVVTSRQATAKDVKT